MLLTVCESLIAGILKDLHAFSKFNYEDQKFLSLKLVPREKYLDFHNHHDYMCNLPYITRVDLTTHHALFNCNNWTNNHYCCSRKSSLKQDITTMEKGKKRKICWNL
ncbi:hypothetical protein QQG55_31400 [Brugia pahangi]